MKKNVIALAVAAAMAAPLAAQAEVTVSGVLQAEIVNVTSDGSRAEGVYMQDASTYEGGENSHNAGGLFFTASEDLGNGMKAIAKYGFNIKTDSGRGDRDAYIGLTGGFGTVLAGRMSSPYKSSTVKWDPFLATFMQARGNGGASAGALGHGSYLNNVLAYANKFGPAKVVLGVSFDETDAGAGKPATLNPDGTTTPATPSTQDGTTEGNHAATFSVNVPVGPVEIALAYLSATDFGQTGKAGDTSDKTETKVGVKYAAGAITAAFQYETRDSGLQGGANADGETFMLLSGSYAFGANTVSLNVGQNTDTFTGGADDVVTSYTAIGVNHAFSKGTSVYAGYRATSPDTTPSDDESLIGVGMRVKF